jgi:hypothetical protein
MIGYLLSSNYLIGAKQRLTLSLPKRCKTICLFFPYKEGNKKAHSFSEMGINSSSDHLSAPPTWLTG